MKVPKLITLSAFAAVISALSNPVSAATIDWQLNGVSFTDGATASGFFDYNTSTQTITSWDITSTAGVGDNIPALSYSSSNPLDPSFVFEPTDVAPFSSSNLPPAVGFNNNNSSTTISYLAFYLQNPINSSSPDPLVTISQGFDSGEIYYAGAGTPFRSFAGGDIVQVAPEVSSLLGFGLPLAMMGLLSIKLRSSRPVQATRV